MNRSSRLQNKTTKTIRYLFSEIEIFIKLNDFMWLVTSGFVKCDEIFFGNEYTQGFSSF